MTRVMISETVFSGVVIAVVALLFTFKAFTTLG